MELVKKAKEIPESPDEKLIEDIIDHKDPWDEPRLLLPNDSDGTILSTGDPHRCLKCGGQGKPSKALLDEMARLCTEDALELGGHVEVPSGAAKMVNCTKCASCGHSWIEDSRKNHNKNAEACMDEIQKCSKSPYYFATNYISIERNGETVPFRTDLTEEQFNGMFRELVENSRKAQ